jgi:hypothetical protein
VTLPDLPIPFGAFQDTALAEPIEIIEDSVDFGTSRTAPGGVATAAGPPADILLPPDHVLIVIGPPLPGDGDAEAVVTQLCRRLAPGELAGVEEHHPAGDLAHWTRIDRDRAAAVAHLDLTICSHELPDAQRHHLVVVEAPERVRGIVTAAVAELPDVRVTAVLTRDGACGLPGPVADQARRTSGRALLFPGQSLLAGDVSADDTLRLTAIDEISSVAGPYAPGAVVRCHGYARPRYHDGSLTLSVTHDRPDELVAVEVRYSRPCCGEAH